MTTRKSRSRRWLSLFTVVGVTAASAVITVIAAPAASADITRVANAGDQVVTADALPTTQIDGVAWTQTVVGNTVYVGGKFANARPAGAAAGTNLTARSNLLAYDITTGVLSTTWAPSANAQVLTVAQSPDGSRIYVGGDFTSINGTARYRVAALDAATGQVIASFAPAISYRVNSIVATNDTVYLGGDFKTVNGVARNNLAAVSASTGALLGWNPSADAEVKAMVMAPAGDKLIVGGRFQNVSGGAAYGMAALNPVNGSRMTWNVVNDVRNAGANAAITSLSTDGTKIYGSGYVYGSGGNLEGAFAADPATGNISWIEDCHGDTYSTFAVNNTVYTVSHAHYCTPVGGYFQSDPWSTNQRHSLAFTANATGTLAHNELGGYYDWYGKPAPSMINWFPNWYTGTYTGQGQAGWSVSGNSKYVVIGGEFIGLNGAAQQGLTRFGVPSVATNKQGPRVATADWTPSTTSLQTGTIRVAIPTNWDRDDKTLTYKLIRDGNTAAPVFTTQGDSTFWERPNMVWTDTGLAPGSTHTYQVIVSDPDKNSVSSTVVSGIAGSTGSIGDYGQRILDDGAKMYWRLGEPSGNTVYDWAAGNDATVGAGVTRGTSGAIANNDNKASTFNGSGTASFSSPLLLFAPDTFTTSAWVRTTTTSGGKIIGFGNSTTGLSGSYDRQTYMQNDGRITFGVYPGGVRTITSPKAYNDGQWHQIVSTLGADGMNLYVDGVKVASRADTTSGQGYTGYWRVGGDNLGGWTNQPSSNFINADLDDVAVFPTALTSDKISAQYLLSGRQLTAQPAPADGYGAAVYADSPTSYWRLGEKSGSTATDSSGGLNSGGYQGGYTQNQPGLLVGTTDTAVAFDGQSGAVVASNLINNPTTYSEEAWFSTTTKTGGKILGFGSAQSGLSGSYDRHVYMQDNGQLVFGVWAGGAVSVVSPKSYNDGVRHHVVATQGSDGMKLYVDGQLVGSNAQTGSAAYAGYWRIGGDATWGSTSPYFAGVIDEAAFYPKALTAQRVAAHYAAGGSNQAPTAAFTVTTTNLTGSFDAGTSNDPDGTIASYAWDFGDGSTGTGKTATHTYAAAGSYTVKLTVTDTQGATGTTSQQVTTTAPPPNQPPTAAFTPTMTNLGVAVDASASTDPDGTIASYAWDFGDGSTGTGKTAAHTYAAAGSYTVTLTVTDNQGATATTTRAVTATAKPNQAPTASFTSSVSAFTANLDGSKSTDPDGTIASYAWDFGDGSTGTGKTAAHTYAAAGSYTVTLTVTDNQGATATTTGPVTVSSALASDLFARTVATGWGPADVGGNWTVSAGSAFAVANGVGSMTLATAGSSQTAGLGSVSAKDVEIGADFSFDKLATGNGVSAQLLTRRVGTSEYRIQAVVYSNGVVDLSLRKLANGVETVLASKSGVATITATDSLSVKFSVVGDTPVLTGKAWKAGTTEPAAPQLTFTDSTAPLSAAGGVGVRGYLSGSAGNAPIKVQLDNLLATAK